ncbi:MAG: transcriptional repressor [Eubacteriales bacterium]
MNSTCKIKWPEGIKKTKQRECVLAMLQSAELPLTAIDIYNRLEQDGVPLSTIYRILETFTERGIAAKIGVMENGMAVYELKRHEHRHYAFCMACHKMIVIENCPMEVFTPELSENNFHVLGHKLEIYGYCGECYTKM